MNWSKCKKKKKSCIHRDVLYFTCFSLAANVIVLHGLQVILKKKRKKKHLIPNNIHFEIGIFCKFYDTIGTSATKNLNNL